LLSGSKHFFNPKDSSYLYSVPSLLVKFLTLQHRDIFIFNGCLYRRRNWLPSWAPVLIIDVSEAHVALSLVFCVVFCWQLLLF